MVENLVRDGWAALDSAELRLFLGERIGAPGQYDGENPDILYLPRAGAASRVALTFRDRRIVSITPGPSFDSAEWDRLSEEIAASVLTGPLKAGREFSFSSFRVLGSWRGGRSGVQILPPPPDAPRAAVEMAEHPFILEFPLRTSAVQAISSFRLFQEHRKLTLLLNVCLAGRINAQPRRPEHFWASISWEDASPQIEWVQKFFFAKLGAHVVDELSPPAPDPLAEEDPQEYYAKSGHDGKGLRVPADLDDSISCYTRLSPVNRGKFDRAAFWMDMASRQWDLSVSASFASLVSAVESLTERGTTHLVHCDQCNGYSQHESPGATERFRAFFELYAPGAALRSRRTEMYSLRSGILHGSELMALDQDLAFGWDPPWWNERELHSELWSVTRIALRNWLKNPTPA